MSISKDIGVMTYVSPRERPLNAQEKAIRDVAYALKKPERWAIEEASRTMLRHIPASSTLVPIPDSSGSTRANLALANAISDLDPTLTVEDVLGRSKPVDSSSSRRRRGLPGIAPEDHMMESRRPVTKGVVFIDNVMTTGSTFEAARKALGQGFGVAFAKANEVTKMARDLRTRYFIAKERSDKEKDEIYSTWKELINMSQKELDDWAENPDRLKASINREEAEDAGDIQSGYDSFHRIKRRKSKPRKDWTADDYDNAAQENGFNSRMLGNDPGDPVGETGRSKWEISLRNWGHDPSKKNSPAHSKWRTWKDKQKTKKKASLSVRLHRAGMPKLAMAVENRDLVGVNEGTLRFLTTSDLSAFNHLSEEEAIAALRGEAELCRDLTKFAEDLTREHTVEYPSMGRVARQWIASCNKEHPCQCGGECQCGGTCHLARTDEEDSSNRASSFHDSRRQGRNFKIEVDAPLIGTSGPLRSRPDYGGDK